MGPKDEIGNLLGVERDLLSVVPDEVQALSEASQEVPGQWDDICCVVQSPHEGVEIPEDDSLCLDGVGDVGGSRHKIVEWENDEEQSGVDLPPKHNLYLWGSSFRHEFWS